MTDREMERELQAAARQFPELRSMFDQLQSALDEIRKTAAQGSSTEALAEADEERAERARAGELGHEWERIQKRIDRGETTLEDVFTGRDSSAEAVGLRQRAVKNLGRLHDQWAKEAEEEKDADNPLTQMRSAQEAQEAKAREMREYVERLPRSW
ncbi:MAG: hypothetical protein Q4D79_09710 [Propionibacteriaceae bacterium]|nr:hypothetical protein [Propionibacteriaceae bacterium]